MKLTLMVGSSTVMRGSASCASTALMVSPICTSSIPDSATMSPASADSTFTRFVPSKLKMALMRTFSVFFSPIRATFWLTEILPRATRMMARRPT